jgi:hypothetical protein
VRDEAVQNEERKREEDALPEILGVPELNEIFPHTGNG